MDPLQGNSGFLEVRATALETILVQGDLAQGISVTAEPTMVRATSGKLCPDGHMYKRARVKSGAPNPGINTGQENRERPALRSGQQGLSARSCEMRGRTHH